jgi:hypothetical protein
VAGSTWEALDLLDEADRLAREARDLRMRVPPTATALGDVAKSWYLLHKIGRGQRCLRDPAFARFERTRLWLDRDQAPAKAISDDDHELELLISRYPPLTDKAGS